ncbi:MAG: FKBP-type peptidyl-prolyl cis-trans isomerase [Flavobacteriales bacterium]
MKYFLISACLLMAAVGCKTSQDTSASFALNNDVDSLSFAIGQSIGSNLGRQDMTDLDPDLIAHGIRTNLAGEGWDEMAVQATIETMLRERQERAMAGRIETETAFLDSVAALPGMVTTDSGLIYQVLQEGSGASPLATDEVEAHYHGMLLNGEVFDSSVDKGRPIVLAVNRFIPGWIEGLQLMKEGAKYKFWIPEGLAYGARPPQGSGIPPNSALIFELELLKVNP